MGYHCDMVLVGGWVSQMMVAVEEEDCLAVNDAKPNVSVGQCLFGKVAAKTSCNY